MKSIAEQLNLIKKNKNIGLMTHVVVGYPSLKETEQLVLHMEEVGIDIVELQIPFSDPIADGPTIMKANDKSIENNITIHDALQLMQRLTNTVKIPLLFMGYYNSLFHYGTERFCKDAEKAGAQGVIIPDMPLDEEAHEHFTRYCERYHLSLIRVLSPTSTNERIAANLKTTQGFIYCTAISGTTGARHKLDTQTKQFLERMKRATDIPLAVGFGISQPEHIKALTGFADIAVIGSAVIQQIEQQGIQGVKEYLNLLVRAGK